MRAVDVIAKKRDGAVLSADEIKWLIDGYVAGDIPDYQMSAFAMAVYFRSMTTREIADLTMAMVHSGDTLDLGAIPGVKVDKHSTGGVGDKVTLILAPLVASFGVPVAKMSGRGLGHTGGTIDKLESIPGFQVELSEEQFIEQVQEIGLSVIGQSEKLVPADKLLYALRDVTATVDTIPLIASSIMSKKIAAGADAILLDVTVGNGAFMKTIEDARQLARTMVDLGNAVGRKTMAVITDMSQPLGLAIGNRNEITEAVQVLSGKPSILRDYIAELAQMMLRLAGLKKTLPEILDHLDNGQALAKFEAMTRAQGGDSTHWLEPLKVAHQVEVKAPQAGVITQMEAMGIGLLAMKLGAGRAIKADSIDFEAGINLAHKVGDEVVKGEVLATLYSNREITDSDVQEFLGNLQIGPSAEPIQEILEVIE
ncbi:MAG: pyrimidine-nucleoside phosphorylase [Streptococcaceae bacterium]|jgi:pyrimidine-nucleoside phosphorylase|nr:pyrimidine-nucleoside phosphorylase [Streptococcaceae bacterium]